MKYIDDQDFVQKYKRLIKIYRELSTSEKLIMDKLDMKITINLSSPNQDDKNIINEIYFKYY